MGIYKSLPKQVEPYKRDDSVLIKNTCFGFALTVAERHCASEYNAWILLSTKIEVEQNWVMLRL